MWKPARRGILGVCEGTMEPVFAAVGEEMMKLHSKSEVLRRVIRIAAREGALGSSTTLDALDRLQSSLRERKVDVAQWGRDLKAERCAAARRLSSKSR